MSEVVQRFKARLQQDARAKQSSIVQDICVLLVHDPFDTFIEKRLDSLVGCCSVRTRDSKETIKKNLNSLPRHWALIAIRSLFNGWVTSSRMHETPVLPSLCGCGKNDDLFHYLRCPRLWGFAHAAACKIHCYRQAVNCFGPPASPGRDGTLNCVLRRLLIKDFSVTNAFLLATISNMYNTLKFQRKGAVLGAISRKAQAEVKWIVGSIACCASRDAAINAPKLPASRRRNTSAYI